MTPVNIAASIQARLLNHAREHREDFQAVLTRYGIERLLYRLGRSKHANDFVLKGAALFVVWTGHTHRPTKDVDFLGYGEDSEQRLASMVRDLCELDVDPDGLVFEADSITVEAIRENQAQYQGKRIKLLARLGRARIPMQIDVGFGDAITPEASDVEFPTLLKDVPSPHIRAYPPATVVAEKFEAMVKLGMDNSRMKDFYDLWLLSRMFDFDTSELTNAVRATFNQRGTSLPTGLPTALTDEFANDSIKDKQWRAYLNKSELTDAPEGLADLINLLRTFLMPVIEAARSLDGSTT